MNIKYVKQKHNNGCFIASLAMVTGYSYDKVFKTVYGKNKNIGKEYPGLTFEHIIRLVDKLNVLYRVSFNKKDLNLLKNNALIVIDYENKKKGFSYDEHSRHCVVFDSINNRILDSYPKYKKRINVNFDYCFDNFSFLMELI